MEVTINYNGQAVAVEVTLEVYEFLDRADHKTENLFHEQRRHWDGREFDEYIITTEGVGVYGETPEEYLCRMETLHELMAVLDTCTEAQRRRFLLYALDGLSLAEIGVLCGCSKVAVYCRFTPWRWNTSISGSAIFSKQCASLFWTSSCGTFAAHLRKYWPQT